MTKQFFKKYSTSQKGDLYKLQKDLPDLPVPKLNETLELYKRSLIPLYPNGENDPAFKSYSKKIDEFSSSNGIHLQSKLENFAKDKRNWLSEFWDDYAYLDYRDPLSPFVSYFYSHKDLNSMVGKDQLLKAAACVLKVVEYATLVENELLEPELRRDKPFCMESFKWMFNNSRIPGKSRDFNKVYDPNDGRFVVVISNGKFFKLETHNQDGPLGIGSLYTGLSEILKESNQNGINKNPVGILTSSNRDIWYENYSNLKKNPINNISLEEIDKSIFVLCLDNENPKTLEAKSRNCWHGNGWNRWFDKPVQIFVSKNGSSGFLGEHSKMDGTPTLSMNDWLVSELEKIEIDDLTLDLEADDLSAKIEELKFEITPEIKEAIQTELITFSKTVNSLDIKVWQYYGIGKDDIKQFKCSPDSFIQMLIQLAYFKYTGVLRPTYESASTRGYFRGRTETCRSVTPETLQFVKDWEDVSKSISEKITSFRNAINSHSEYIRKASNGHGVDRHLFGLNQMIEKDQQIPEIFSDPMYKYSQYWYLSTSQLSSENFNGYGWSPVVPEGFGLAYMVNKSWLHVNVTAHKDNVYGLKVDEMAACLTQAAHELKEALSKEQIKAKL